MTPVTPSLSDKLSPTMRLRLSLMMFLQFFVWGAWFVTLGTFLGLGLSASGSQISLAYLTRIPRRHHRAADHRSDRRSVLLRAEDSGGAAPGWRGLVVAGLRCVGLRFVLPADPGLHGLVHADPGAGEFGVVPADERPRARQFPGVRVLGTIGWIIAGLIIGWLGWEQGGELALTFKMAAVASLVLGLFSFTLPATPPTRRGEKSSLREMLGLEALGLLKSRSYLVFFLSSIAICVPLAFYYNFTNLFLNESGVQAAAAVQSLGQVSEVLFLLLLPFLLKRLGVKKTLAVGMAAWALRYICFGFGDAGAWYWLLIVGLLLHGVCYDFFFVAGQIYTNRFAGDRFRSSAQGLITLATYGVGILIGSLVSGPIVDYFATADGHQWRQIWIVPAIIAGVVLVVFLLLFKERDTTAPASIGLESEVTTLEAPGAPLPSPTERTPER